jgi:hypothetical protein
MTAEQIASVVGNLTEAERTDWDNYLRWYESNGWSGEAALNNAWTDLSRKYPQLSESVK